MKPAIIDGNLSMNSLKTCTYGHIWHGSNPWSQAICAILSLTTHSEVCKFDHAVFVAEDIGWFYISVHDLSLMQVSQSLQNLNSKQANDRFWNLANFLKDVCQGSTVHILESNIDFSFFLKCTVGSEHIVAVAIM